MTIMDLSTRCVAIACMTLTANMALGGELRDAPFWAALQSLNTLVPEAENDPSLGVIFLDLDVPILLWSPVPRETQRHSVLWFKVEGQKNAYGGLFLSALDSEKEPFFFPVDPDISLRCADIDETLSSVEMMEEVERFIDSWCEQ